MLKIKSLILHKNILPWWKQQAEEQILALGKALQRAGRSEEAIKAMTDEKYLKELLKEFGI
ncbi:hypothetical protein AAAT63_01040 [Dorea ammoniilytica]